MNHPDIAHPELADPFPASKSDETARDAVGTAVGGGGGVVAGAVAGTLAGGPLGTVVGGIVGGVVGAVGGRALSEEFDWTPVDNHWRQRFDKEPYYQRGFSYDDYAPAYRIGAAMRKKYPDGRYEDARADMAKGYEELRGESKLAWDQAERAAEASFRGDYFY